MEKEFLPYELALKLKELGFNEDCFAWYDANSFNDIELEFEYKNNKDLYFKESCTAPLWQQVFDWFREKYNLIGNPTPCDFNRKDTKFDFIINGNIHHRFKTYEEARLACLEKLIEIVENNK